uniref:Anthranilate synthase component 2 n=1 Tax=Acrochaetium secundatum TaxID=209631 RepID=A0A4D6BKL3_9FLOR|nr:anthranilate synthase component II [Acrochaetium secundatum]QBX88325.1 anthranilate synthase component II [Acrochaetium secundatum]
MILIIDNYDSFTYNLVQYIGELGLKVKVVRNNIVSLQEIQTLSPKSIIISPGPGSPGQSGICIEVIKLFSAKVPILGVCLGHQIIAQMSGANIVRAPVPIHGKTSLIYHNGKGLFKNITNPFTATRYHSLAIEPVNLPYNLITTAWSDQGVIMGCGDTRYPLLTGIQFHPESLWTTEGKNILLNFLKLDL